MKEKIVLDSEFLKRYGIDAIEYLYLYHVFHGIKSKNFISSMEISPFETLQQKGFLKINYTLNTIDLREKALNLFEGDKDYFYTFLSTFPVKTPSGRPLSPKDENTIKGKKIRQKWNKLFKNNSIAARKAIKVLEAEMEWRRKTGKFEFMHNAETWLNQGDFENFEYLLKDKEKENKKLREDFE